MDYSVLWHQLKKRLLGLDIEPCKRDSVRIQSILLTMAQLEVEEFARSNNKNNKERGK